MMLASAAVLAVIAAVAVAAGGLLGIGGGFVGGLFAGVGTSTPTLAAATRVTGGSTDPAVGYALTYPLGVVLGIVVIHMVMKRTGSTPKDKPSAAASGLTDLTVVVARKTNLSDVPGAAEGDVRFSFWRHGGTVEVSAQRETVEPGDRVVVIGPEPAVAVAVDWLGTRADEHLAHDRREVDFRRVLLSNAALAGRSIEELDVPGRFGGSSPGSGAATWTCSPVTTCTCSWATGCASSRRAAGCATWPATSATRSVRSARSTRSAWGWACRSVSWWD